MVRCPLNLFLSERLPLRGGAVGCRCDQIPGIGDNILLLIDLICLINDVMFDELYDGKLAPDEDVVSKRRAFKLNL